MWSLRGAGGELEAKPALSDSLSEALVSLSRTTLALVGVGAVGVALVGVGAGASFTASTSSTQKITAGTMQVSLTADGVEGATCSGSSCTLPDLTLLGSTFVTPETTFTVENTGDLPVWFDYIQVSETHGDNPASWELRNHVNVCIESNTGNGTPLNEGPVYNEANGPLWAAVSLQPTVVQNPSELKPGESKSYSVKLYAGQDVDCGDDFNGASADTRYSDGTNTRNAFFTEVGSSYTTPASLENAAMGGEVSPTLTWHFVDTEAAATVHQ